MKDIYEYQGRIVIPDDENVKRQLLRNAHDHVTSGHPRIQETIKRVQLLTYWPNMTTYIQNYVKGCPVCQQYKINRHLTKPPL
jgi:hypothetical protein